MNREPIHAALFAKLAAIPGFKTASRRFKHFGDVAQPDQPALFVIQRRESATTVPGQPTVWLLKVDVLIYVNTGQDKSVAPASILNPLLDAVVAALAPDPITNKCTLGGLVQHAVIQGEIETDEGQLGEQGLALIPIEIKAV